MIKMAYRFLIVFITLTVLFICMPFNTYAYIWDTDFSAQYPMIDYDALNISVVGASNSRGIVFFDYQTNYYVFVVFDNTNSKILPFFDAATAADGSGRVLLSLRFVVAGDAVVGSYAVTHVGISLTGDPYELMAPTPLDHYVITQQDLNTVVNLNIPFVSPHDSSDQSYISMFGWPLYIGYSNTTTTIPVAHAGSSPNNTLYLSSTTRTGLARFADLPTSPLYATWLPNYYNPIFDTIVSVGVNVLNPLFSPSENVLRLALQQVNVWQNYQYAIDLLTAQISTLQQMIANLPQPNDYTAQLNQIIQAIQALASAPGTDLSSVTSGLEYIAARLVAINTNSVSILNETRAVDDELETLNATTAAVNALLGDGEGMSDKAYTDDAQEQLDGLKDSQEQISDMTDNLKTGMTELNTQLSSAVAQTSDFGNLFRSVYGLFAPFGVGIAVALTFVIVRKVLGR